MCRTPRIHRLIPLAIAFALLASGCTKAKLINPQKANGTWGQNPSTPGPQVPAVAGYAVVSGGAVVSGTGVTGQITIGQVTGPMRQTGTGVILLSGLQGVLSASP